jgi:exosortase
MGKLFLTLPVRESGWSGQFGAPLCIACPHQLPYAELSYGQQHGHLLSPTLQTEPLMARQYSGSFRGVPLWQVGLLASLCLWLYWSTLTHLVGQWWHDSNFSHGFFVPLFAGYVVWQQRTRLARIAPKPSWFGLALVVLALAVLIVGQLGAELFTARFSLLILLAGILVLFQGWNFFRAVLFPWAFLMLMIPIPSIVFNQITIPLQFIASQLSAQTLEILYVPVELRGNILNLASIQLEVADACSGIRSLMSLLTLSIIYGYLLEKRLWVRWFLALASVPIAIAANSIRIIGTGLLATYWDPDKAEGYFHASWGILVFMVSLLLLYGLHSLIRWLLRDQEAS